MATKKQNCDIICIPRAEYERLRALDGRKTPSKPSVATAPARKPSTARKTAAAKRTVAAPTKKAATRKPRPKLLDEMTLIEDTPRRQTKKKSATKKRAVKTNRTKTPKTKGVSTKSAKKTPKKSTERVVTAKTRVVRDEDTPYFGKTLERREKTPRIERTKTPRIEKPKKERPEREKKERGSLLGKLKRTKEVETVAVDETRQVESPTATYYVHEQPKQIAGPPALPAPKDTDDENTITLDASDYKVQDYEDCSQYGFLERQKCKRRNRKLAKS